MLLGLWAARDLDAPLHTTSTAPAPTRPVHATTQVRLATKRPDGVHPGNLHELYPNMNTNPSLNLSPGFYHYHNPNHHPKHNPYRRPVPLPLLP